ncbi:hypothetical protein [Nostoc sp.]|uniref:hypothetical protein n=1 Tax=Nostoc sp. TaxID=1180 RepID=UPI002FF53307
MNKKQFEQTEGAIALQKKIVKTQIGQQYPSISQAQANYSEPLWNHIVSSNAKINTFNYA